MPIFGPRNKYSALGYDLAYDAVSPGHWKTIVKLNIWYNTTGWVRDDFNTLEVWGDFSGKWVNNTINLKGGETILLKQLNIEMPLKWGAETYVSFGARFISNAAGDCSVTGGIWIPRRPQNKPNAPTGVRVIKTHAPDGRLNLQIHWDRNTTQQAPYAVQAIERRTPTTEWYRLGTLYSWQTDYFDINTWNADKFQYRIAAGTTEGQWSDWADSPWVASTPNRPEAVVAKRQGRGNYNVVIRWAPATTYVTGAKVYDNGMWIGTVNGTDTKWVHENADREKTHVYTVTTLSDDLESAHSIPSNPILLDAAPAKPDHLDPNGEWISKGLRASTGQPVGGWMNTRWRFNPLDGSDLTAYEITWKKNTDEKFRNPIKVGEAAIGTDGTSYNISLDGSEGETFVDWRVRSWGWAEDKPSEWSDTARAYLQYSPWVKITNLSIDNHVLQSKITSNSLELQLNSDDPETTQWTVEARKDTGLGEVIDYTTFNAGQDTSYRIRNIPNGITLFVRVSCQAKLPSLENRCYFTGQVEYVAPGKPIVEPYWSEDMLMVTLNITPAAFDPNGDPAFIPTKLRVEGTDVDGTWRTLQDNMPPSQTTFMDPHASGVKPSIYRVYATSQLGLESYTEVVVNPDPKLNSIALSSKEGSSLMARIRYDPEISVSRSYVEREFHHFMGRDRPVVFSGNAQNVKITVAGILLRVDSDVDNPARTSLEKAALSKEPLLYRDPTGARMWVAVEEGVSFEREQETGAWKVSMSLREVDVSIYA
jgi:hypothetical protein